MLVYCESVQYYQAFATKGVFVACLSVKLGTIALSIIHLGVEPSKDVYRTRRSGIKPWRQLSCRTVPTSSAATRSSTVMVSGFVLVLVSFSRNELER